MLAFASLLLLLLLTLLALSLKEDFFKASNFCKKHVALGAARIAIGSNVFRPEVPRHKLIRFSLKRLKFQQMVDDMFLFGSLLAREFEFANLSTADRPRQSGFHDAEIVLHRGAHGNFLQC